MQVKRGQKKRKKVDICSTADTRRLSCKSKYSGGEKIKVVHVRVVALSKPVCGGPGFCNVSSFFPLLVEPGGPAESTAEPQQGERSTVGGGTDGGEGPLKTETMFTGPGEVVARGPLGCCPPLQLIRNGASTGISTSCSLLV